MLKGKNSGQIIVRSQTLSSASNLIAKISPVWSSVKNLGGGCMGMCTERQWYVCHIMKEVPGDNDRFVVAYTFDGRFNSA